MKGDKMKKAKSSILFGIIASIFILNVSLAFAKTVIVIQPHPDDEILVCAHVKHLLDEGHDVKYIWLFSDGEYSWLPGGRLYNAYYDPDNGTVKENYPVVKGLGVPVENMYFIGGGWSMTADMHLLKKKLIGLFNEINPDEIFVLQYNGGHYAHDLTAMVVRAAVEKLNSNPKVFEYAIANSYWTLITFPRSLYPDYDLMCEEFVKKYSIIPRDPGYAKEIDLTSVDVTTPEDMDVLVNYLKLYKDCVPVGIYNLCMKANREDLIYKFLREVQKFQQPVDSRQYTLPVSAFFNRPFETSAANPDGVLLYEKNSTIRYEDFNNYTKYMASRYGAVLHTKPWKNPMEVYNVSADRSLSFDLYVGNISSEEDTFSISLAAGPNRESLDGICTISQESVTISGPCDPANPDTYETLTLAINNTTDLPVTGKVKGKDVCTIWIKAVSANAWVTNRLTDFVEKPINIAVSSLPSAVRLPE